MPDIDKNRSRARLIYIWWLAKWLVDWMGPDLHSVYLFSFRFGYFCRKFACIGWAELDCVWHTSLPLRCIVADTFIYI